MHRFFTTPENIKDGIAVLSGTDVSHLRNVLRLKKEDRVKILDGSGKCYIVTLISVKRDIVKARIESIEEVGNCESTLEIYLGQCLVKGNGFDSIVRRAVELGVGRITPICGTRCVAKLSEQDSIKKITRWQRISREAVKQCGRSRIPTIGPKPISVEEFCYANRDSELRLIFWEEERLNLLNNFTNQKNVKSAAVLIGPEGGFSSNEIDSAQKYGFTSISLGPRMLRTDTAPIAVLAILQNYWGDL